MTNINMEVASQGNAQTMEVASRGNAQTMQVVVALNVVDMDEYVKKTELEAMNVMTWGDETTSEE